MAYSSSSLSKELREDRETLKEYFSVRDFVANNLVEDFDLRTFYLSWLEAEPREKAKFQREFGHIINPIEKTVSQLQVLMREENKEVDHLLDKWEYSTALIKNVENIAELVGAQ